MKNNQQITGLIIAGIFVLVIAYYYIAPSADTTMGTDTATTTPAASEPAPVAVQPTATTYTNPQLGFSIVLPIAWHVVSADDTHVEFSTGSAEAAAHTSVMVEVNSGLKTLAAIKDAEAKQHSSAVFSDIALGGEPAFVEKVDGTSTLFAVHKGYIYELSGPMIALVTNNADGAKFTYTR
ncbi:MAG TPA: hypothetical protein VHC20_07550 [Candidatus Paceibacterota bacterium]|nr:hypothetical protein [Candidatus Paceibacterota bacterium]